MLPDGRCSQRNYSFSDDVDLTRDSDSNRRITRDLRSRRTINYLARTAIHLPQWTAIFCHRSRLLCRLIARHPIYYIKSFRFKICSPLYCFTLLNSLSFLQILPLPSNRQHLSYDVCLEVRGEIIRTVLCCIVHVLKLYSHKHTQMSSSYSYLDWVLSHWAHFTVRRFICVCVYLCVFVSYCIVVVSL